MIYFACNNPDKWALLDQLSIPYEVLKMRLRPEDRSDLNETPLNDESASTYVQRLALHRAQVAAERVHQRFMFPRPILAAHTALSFKNMILERPGSEIEAFRVLKMLSGQTHQVLTAVALVYKEHTASVLSVSEVKFHELSDETIFHYIENEDGILEKRGGYEMAGLAASFIEGINGSDSGIKGLPLYETSQLLERLKHFNLTPSVGGFVLYQKTLDKA
jgi:septum formation protein